MRIRRMEMISKGTAIDAYSRRGSQIKSILLRIFQLCAWISRKTISSTARCFNAPFNGYACFKFSSAILRPTCIHTILVFALRGIHQRGCAVISFALTSGPLASSISTTSLWLFRSARLKRVLPSFAFTLTSAPLVSSTSTIFL